jgi:ubiquinone/menaquinone biosynthesis C-methylase UbiE
MKTLKQWNDASDWYDKNMGENGDQLNNDLIAPVMEKMLGNIRGKTILDCGCGNGYLTSQLAKDAEKVIGIDFAEEFIKMCRQKYSSFQNLSFQQQDLMIKIPFEDDQFDLVLAKMVLHYVPNISVFAKETKRILKNGGEIVFAVDHPFNSQFYFAQSVAGKPNPKYPGLKDYFDLSEEKKLSLWGKVELTWYPKKISDYIMPFVENRLTLMEMIEIPEQKNNIKIPRILLLKFRK